MITGQEARFAEATITGHTNHPVAFAIINSAQVGAVQEASAGDKFANIVNNLSNSGRGFER